MNNDSRLPNFLIIGAAKCGTTTLWSMLRGHPDIHMPEPKELAFFVLDGPCHRLGLDWYCRQFAEAGGATAVGEATPYASSRRNDLVAGWIATVLPEARFIYVARDPVDQLPSEYLYHLGQGTPLGPFPRALRNEWFIQGAAHYARIQPFLDRFGRERILPLCLEDLLERPAEVIAMCDRFLGVDPGDRPPVTLRRENATARKKLRDVSRAVEWAHRLPAATALESVVPGRAKRFLKRTLNNIGGRSPLPAAPTWDRESIRVAHERLSDDAGAYLSMIGARSDRWRITNDHGLAAAGLRCSPKGSRS